MNTKSRELRQIINCSERQKIYQWIKDFVGRQAIDTVCWYFCERVGTPEEMRALRLRHRSSKEKEALWSEGWRSTDEISFFTGEARATIERNIKYLVRCKVLEMKQKPRLYKYNENFYVVLCEVALLIGIKIKESK